MRRPTTCSASPIRTTSTSGSSGIRVGRDGPPRDLRDLLLGFLLGAPGAAGEHPLPDVDLGGEPLVVVGSLALEHVARDTEVVGGCDLLQRRLPVEAGAELGGVGDHRVEDGVDDLGRALDAELHVDGTEEGLDGVGQYRGLVASTGGGLAAAETDVVADPECAGHNGEG